MMEDNNADASNNATTETSGSLFSKLTSMISGGSASTKDALEEASAAGYAVTKEEPSDRKPPTASTTTATATTTAIPPPPKKKKAGRPPKNYNASSRKKREAEIAANAARPRPFAYKWLKAVDASGVFVPSSLVVVAARSIENSRALMFERRCDTHEYFTSQL